MTEKKQLDWRIVCTGIIALVVYGIYTASIGQDGFIRTLIVGIICLAIGVKLPDFIKSK